MENWNPRSTDNFVEAIEEGKIVRVSEEYARMEGLPILKKPEICVRKPRHDPNEEEHLSLEDFRKPLNWQKSQVMAELIENFHWKISRKRKELGITRRQMAQVINEPENNIKLLENGILPKSDFIIINKIQSYLKINLRKDNKDYTQPMRTLVEKSSQEENKKPQKDGRLLGDDIQIIE